MMKSRSKNEAFALERQRMVEQQIRARDIYDQHVLEAMRTVPRHRFIPSENLPHAYMDGPLPIGCGQTISQPYIVALMTQMLRLNGDETVLEVGTGSGYQAAILASLVRKVITIERFPELAKNAAKVLKELGFTNVEVHVGDGSLGWQEQAPYQAIMVTAAAPLTPKSLLSQLDDHGRLVIPVGEQWGQYLERWIRQGMEFNREVLIPVAFVPLRGEEGWKDERWELD
jgi:protein-L-isoaspartate(D-aspartate) O-methyltransferase